MMIVMVMMRMTRKTVCCDSSAVCIFMKGMDGKSLWYGALACSSSEALKALR